MSFYFDKREDREAFRRIRELFLETYGKSNKTYFFEQWCEMEEGARQFDILAENYGIKPLSEEHMMLKLCLSVKYQNNLPTMNVLMNHLASLGLVIYVSHEWVLTEDKGVPLTQRLDSMCKVTK